MLTNCSSWVARERNYDQYSDCRTWSIMVHAASFYQQMYAHTQKHGSTSMESGDRADRPSRWRPMKKRRHVRTAILSRRDSYSPRRMLWHRTPARSGAGCLPLLSNKRRWLTRLRSLEMGDIAPCIVPCTAIVSTKTCCRSANWRWISSGSSHAMLQEP